MSSFTNRRDFLKNHRRLLRPAPALGGVGLIGAPSGFHAAERDVSQPEKRRETTPFACFAGAGSSRGDNRQLHGQREEIHTDKTGVEVRVDNEGWEDVRAEGGKSAANTGAGPDIILSTNDDANLYPEKKLLDVTDLCDYLGKKYGGWYQSCEAYLKAGWQKVDRGAARFCRLVDGVYRESMLKAAGIDKFSARYRRLSLAMFNRHCTRKARRAEWRSAMPPAISGWTHWLMWAFGGKIVDKDNKVVIDSPETIKALEYAKELYPTFHPRHAVVARSEQQQGVP